MAKTTTGPKLPDLQSLIQAGIDPKTGLPIKCDEASDKLKENIRRALRILDEQNAINRYTWGNLPDGLDGQLLERILYYRGQGAFFYLETRNEFFFLPYALSGTIDVYGRFKSITPLPFNGSTAPDKPEKPWISGLIKNVVEEVQADLNLETFTNGCVLLHDYCKQQGQINISRQVIQEPILDLMSECFPYMRTALIRSTGIKGMRVNNENDYVQVELASQSVKNSALNGKPWIPMVSNVEYQELMDGQVGKSEEFLLAMQSMDNFRLSLYGLSNGGLFQKKSHMLEAEQNMNAGNVGLVYQDGLTIRQKFCDIVNSIWNLGIYCEASETVTNIDKNLDGEISDRTNNNPVNAPYDTSAQEGDATNED